MPARDASAALIMGNPLLEQRIICHPYYVYFRRYLAQRGILTVHLDYAGTGSSFPPGPLGGSGKGGILPPCF